VTINEASKLIGKSKQTLYRWRADGCNIYDERSLIAYSDMMDMRSVGKSALLVRERPDVCQLAGTSFPGDSDQARHALSILEGLKAAFSKRLEKLKKLEDQTEAEMLAEELNLLSEAARMLDMVIGAYFG
jgi:hypothetical protein